MEGEPSTSDSLLKTFNAFLTFLRKFAKITDDFYFLHAIHLILKISYKIGKHFINYRYIKNLQICVSWIRYYTIAKNIEKCTHDLWKYFHSWIIYFIFILSMFSYQLFVNLKWTDYRYVRSVRQLMNLFRIRFHLFLSNSESDSSINQVKINKKHKQVLKNQVAS